MKAQRGSLLIYGLIALAILAALGTIAKAIYDAGGDAVRVEWDKAKEERRKEEQTKIGKADANKQKGDDSAKIIYRKITQTVDRYIDRPVYRNICFDDDGLRDANAALRGALADPAKPAGRVP